MKISSRFRAPLGAMLFLGFACLLAAEADAQTACTPVTLLFRHAEDAQGCCPTKLTAAGTKHAQLYGYCTQQDSYNQCVQWSGMVADFLKEKTYCPLKRVYAMTNYLPGSPTPNGTSNPLLTAMPLSSACCNEEPHTTVKLNGTNYKLYEYINSSTSGGLVSDRLYNEIKELMNQQQSAAIFWTSDGMYDAGRALARNTISQKNLSVLVKGSGSQAILRSSANVFKWDTAKNGFSSFNPTTWGKNIQCFNYNPNNNPVNEDKNFWNCMLSGSISLPDSSNIIPILKGHICTSTSDVNQGQIRARCAITN